MSVATLNNDRNCPFKCCLYRIDGAVGGLIHKQLSQVRYHLKAEHLQLSNNYKIKTEQTNGKQCFNLLSSGIVNTEKMFHFGTFDL